MSALSMSRAEREAFLAGVHVGVVSIAESGRGPLAVPVWYGYEPGGDLWFLTGRGTRKAVALRQAGRASFCAQTENAPYQYVAVEGGVRIEDSFDPDRRRELAEKYLGPEFGALYLASTEETAAEDVTVYLHPEHWLSVDYNKMFG
jgi:nitroimidazol reductase NimA-like FMN-containing flavoprotein (pyridoxamine 5'-phosphate oxidase superfamily)